MDTRSSLDDLKDRGAGVPAPAEAVRLYRQAFGEFGSRALWSSKAAKQPTVAAVLSITESLRVEGDLDARRLAERIEAACRAAL